MNYALGRGPNNAPRDGLYLDDITDSPMRV